MEKLKYSDYAIAFKFEILNNEQDFGQWEMFFEEGGELIEGRGIEELYGAFSKLREDQINVIYVKNLNCFELIGENFFIYSFGDFKAVIKKGQVDFFKLYIQPHIELRNWDKWYDGDSCEEFIRQLDLSRRNFNSGYKEKLGLQNHYAFTKANDQWNDIVNKYYLKKSWANNFREGLLPQDEIELDLYLRIYKGSFYFTNPNFINKEIDNVRMFDISSSHSGFMIRKRYPCKSAQKVKTQEEAFEIIDKGFYAWIAQIKFLNLREKVELPIDLRQFGYQEKDTNNWTLILTDVHWQTFKKIFGAEDMEIKAFYFFQKKELEKNYAVMLNELYQDKEIYKKNQDDFVSGIFKFRTELPFGQSIKSPLSHVKVRYNEESNEFEKINGGEEAFEETIKTLRRYALPLQVGIWTAAYSWSEEIEMILRIGIDNVIYGDTDCVAYQDNGELNQKIIEYNKKVDEEVHSIEMRRYYKIDKKLGRWQDKGVYNRFKAIGVKWYLVEKENKLDVKAAGADNSNLIKWLKEQENPFESFDKEMEVEGLFKNVYFDYKNKCIRISSDSFMSKQLQKEIEEKTNGFVI